MIGIARRAWRYLAAWLGEMLDSVADPRVQLEQAIEEAKRQHQLLVAQAAAVLGNRRELEIRLSRSRQTAAGLASSAGRSLQLAAAARARGDSEKAASLESAARMFAGRLAWEETATANLEELYNRSAAAADAARRAVEQNSRALERTVAERTGLLSELAAARMQERLAEAIGSVGELAPAAPVPSLARVRERIDARFALAAGSVDLAAGPAEVARLEVERAGIDEVAERRLEEIRRELGRLPS